MENKLKISENTVVHCATEKEANEVLKIADSLGYTWNDGCKYTNISLWDKYKHNTCYHFNRGNFSEIDAYNTTHYKIISAQEFSDLHDVEEENIYLYKKEMEDVGYKFDTMNSEDIK